MESNEDGFKLIWSRFIVGLKYELNGCSGFNSAMSWLFLQKGEFILFVVRISEARSITLDKLHGYAYEAALKF